MKTILAIDPSGSYNEGKGTTGLCVYRHPKIRHLSIVKAKDYASQADYWNAVMHYMDVLIVEHKVQVIVVEDYFLYAQRAKAQINSKFETSQLIGAIKIHYANRGIPLVFQAASEVKKRWANHILIHKGLVYPSGTTLRDPSNGQVISKHSLDALRHALHYNLKELKNVRKNKKRNIKNM